LHPRRISRRPSRSLALLLTTAVAGAVLPLTLLGVAPANAAANTTLRVSIASGGAQGNGEAQGNFAVSSGDGRYVAFDSAASNMVSGDTNGAIDVFVRDNVLGTTQRVSVASDGSQGNGASQDPTMSSDGRYVAFTSFASNLVSGDTNGVADVFVRDLLLGTTQRVSIASDGTQATGQSAYAPRISLDGQFVVFGSDASNLVASDTNGTTDVFLRDLVAGTTERISVASSGTQGNGQSGWPAVSDDGRYVAFMSQATTFATGDNNGNFDVFLRDRVSATTTLISANSSGLPGNGTTGFGSALPSMSSDGRYIVFYSSASDLVAGDSNGVEDIFVRDLQAGTMQRVSVDSSGTQSNGMSLDPNISTDGRFVTFSSVATNLISGDTNAVQDVFVRDLAHNTTERVSVSSTGAQGDQNSAGRAAITTDGRLVAFWSRATTLVSGDTNAAGDVFTRERAIDNVDPIGAVEQATGTQVSGWAYDPNNPTGASTVNVDVDAGTPQSQRFTVTANLYRPDANPPVSNGFQWLVPSALQDGANHTVKVSVLDYPSNMAIPIGNQSSLSFLTLADDFTGTNGVVWNSSKWGGLGGTVDVLTNQGRLLVATQDAKAVATKMPPVGDADLTYTYRFDDRSSLSGFRTVLRGDGAFPLTSGYRLEILSDSTAIKVRRFSGTIGTVCQTGCSYTYTKDTNAQQVRFQVQGAHVRVKTWLAGTTEPSSWQIDWTDPSPLPAGVLQLQHNWTSGTRSVLLDNLVLNRLSPINEPDPQTAPLYSVSRYMNKTPTTAQMQTAGAEAGNRGPSLAVLDFGEQDGTIGTRAFGSKLNDQQISDLSIAFINGFYSVAPAGRNLILAVGTTNSGYQTDTDAQVKGKDWANLINSIYQTAVLQHPTVDVAGANDFEAGRGFGGSAPSRSRAWVAGFDAQSADRLMINYGAANGCPPAGSCTDGWTQDDYWFLTGGPSSAKGLPEIYASSSDEQWAQIGIYGYDHHNSSKIDFLGSLTQQGACNQRDPQRLKNCKGTDNGPDTGWSNFRATLRLSPKTDQPVGYSSDILWNGG
jgi:Tol biopolymer transport system component